MKSEKKKYVFMTLPVTKEELTYIDSMWRPNQEYRSRVDYMRSRLGLRRSCVKDELETDECY